MFIVCTSSAHVTLSILSIVFIFSIKLNSSSVFLNIQVHKISKLPVSSDTAITPRIPASFYATS
jgi:hypothetical protein